MEIALLVGELRAGWRRQGLLPPDGASESRIDLAERLLGVRFAPALRQLYAVGDGGPDPAAIDEEPRLWQLDQLESANVGGRRLIVFADWMISSVVYLVDPPTALVYLQDVGEDRPGIPLAEFLRMMLRLDRRLYG